MTGLPSICPAPEALAAYVHLGPEGALEVGGHIDSCPRCRREVMVLFDRLAADEPDAEGSAELDAELWDRLRDEHRNPVRGRVLRLRLEPMPMFMTPQGEPLPRAAAGGVRGAAGAQAANMTELDLDHDSTLLVSVRGESLLLRASRARRPAQGVMATISRVSDGARIAVLETDLRGRAKLPIALIAEMGECEIRVDL